MTTDKEKKGSFVGDGSETVDALVQLVAQFFKKDADAPSLASNIWYNNGSLKPEKVIREASAKLLERLPGLAEASFLTRKKEFLARCEAEVNVKGINFQVIFSSGAEKVTIQIDKSLREALLSDIGDSWQISALICAAMTKALIQGMGKKNACPEVAIEFGKTKFEKVLEFEKALSRQSLALIINNIRVQFGTSSFKEGLRDCPRFVNEHTAKDKIDHAINEYLRTGLKAVVEDIALVCQKAHFKEVQTSLNTTDKQVKSILNILAEQVSKIRVFEFRARNNAKEGTKELRRAKSMISPGRADSKKANGNGNGNKDSGPNPADSPKLNPAPDHK